MRADAAQRPHPVSAGLEASSGGAVRADATHAAASAPMLREAVAHLAPTLPLLQELGERFAAAGHELALVGGPVRDAFLGRVSGDLDLTTSARPEQIEAVVAGWADARWDVGRDFGTIAMRKGAHTIEITTFSKDDYNEAIDLLSEVDAWPDNKAPEKLS